jgi:hypothetical protein
MRSALSRCTLVADTHLKGRLMAFGLKVLLSITAPLLVVVTPSIAADFTYKEYAKESDIWKRGFVLSISQYMSAMPQPDEEAPYPVRNAFERCLASSTDAVLVRHGWVVSNNGLKWAICWVRSAERLVGFRAGPLDAFSSRRRRTALSSAHGAGRVWC